MSLFCSLNVISQDIKPIRKAIPVVSKDTTFSKKILSKKDSISIPKDSLVKPKEAIDGIIVHDAEDYSIQDAKKNILTLYNKAVVKYQNLEIKAGIIIIDNNKETLIAKGIKDSLGYHQKPQFKQDGQESEQDSLIYNFKSKKAIIYGVKTTQSGIITYGTKTKRVNDSTIYMRKLRFTTSKNFDYYIATNKAKMVPGKKIIVGLSNLVIADVPLPVALPFAYLPLGDKRTSGFIIPTYGQSNTQGYFLQNGGYYFAINDYFDLTALGDVYSNGSWGLRFDSSYKMRYKFNGNFSIRFENVINSIKGFDDYGKSTNFNINWRHSQDQKASPNSRFSASVNLGSSKYFRESLNQNNNSQFQTNTLSSSISYYKNFVGTPFNMNVTATHQQNTNTEEINMTLPSLQLNMDRINPFKGKGGVQKNAFQKIGLNYSMKGEYRIKTTDSLFFKPEMFKTALSGVKHNASLSTAMKVMKYFTLSPSVNYSETWNFNYINKRFDKDIKDNTGAIVGGVVIDSLRGFKTFREYNANLSLSTTLYGDFNFKGKRLKAIRHTMRPSISYGYKPNFAKSHSRTIVTDLQGTTETYSIFENSLYRAPLGGTSNALTFSVNNTIEAKVAPKDPESDEEDKKITILNNLSLNASYDLTRDSLRWSTISMSTGTRLFKDKLNLTLSGSFDPYQVKKVNGTIININKFNSFPRLQSATINANYSLSSKDFEKTPEGKKKNNQNNIGNNQTPDVFGQNINPANGFSSQLNGGGQEETTKEAKLYQAKMPWNLNLVYTASYSNDGINSSTLSNNSLMFSGDLEFSPKWKVGFNSAYDLKEQDFGFTSINFSRDLDSWRFNFNWVPFGARTSYYFFIGVKSSVLQDLKWEKRSLPDRRLF
ncbi:MAG: putative LPS assembly protein LptD [Flavobacteriaceae bacterium]